jgi:hypothetical protein
MIAIPHPIWVWVVALPLFPAAAYLGTKLASGRADKPAPEPVGWDA